MAARGDVSKSDVNRANWLALLGLVFGVAGFATALVGRRRRPSGSAG